MGSVDPFWRKASRRIRRTSQSPTWSEDALARHLGVSKRFIDHCLVTDPSFPRPIFVDDRRVWRVPDIEAWLTARSGQQITSNRRAPETV